MRVTLDEMMDSLGKSLTQIGETVDRLLVAVYTADSAERAEIVAQKQREVEEHAATMEALIIDVLATQQPVVATDLSVVKGVLVASRLLGYVAHEYRELAHLMDQTGIPDPNLPPEVTAVLPEVWQVVTESIAAFLHDDRILADFTLERIGRLEQVILEVTTPLHPSTLVPVQQLHRLALGRVLDAASVITRSAPLYRYVVKPS